MGKWNYRRSRRFSYRHQYRDPASSYYDSYKHHAPLPDFTEDGIPIWEKKFCSLIGSVPWQKIVNVKEYMICHDNVVNWDDSASEAAFQTAKQRFWAEINGVHNEHSLPDPDMYIDEINWNPDIDIELIKDLELSRFVPPEEEEDHEHGCKGNIKNTISLLSAPSDEWNEIRTPAEWNNNVPNNVASDNKSQGWNEWPTDTDNSRNTNNGWHGNHANQLKDWNNCALNNDDNPWEQSFFEKNKSAQDDDPWNKADLSKDCHTKADHLKPSSWGYDPGKEKPYKVDRSKDWHTSGNPWKHNRWGYDHGNEKPWGNSGHSYRQNNQLDNREMNNSGGEWARSRGSQQDRQWRGRGRNGNSWRRSEDQYREQKGSGSQQPSRNWGTWTESHRKREGSHQYATGNKHTRFGESNYQTGHQWS